MTYVYYPSAEYEGVARGIMQLIGAADVRLSGRVPDRDDHRRARRGLRAAARPADPPARTARIRPPCYADV